MLHFPFASKLSAFMQVYCVSPFQIILRSQSSAWTQVYSVSILQIILPAEYYLIARRTRPRVMKIVAAVSEQTCSCCVLFARKKKDGNAKALSCHILLNFLGFLGCFRGRQSCPGLVEACRDWQPFDLYHRRRGVDLQRHWTRVTTTFQVFRPGEF